MSSATSLTSAWSSLCSDLTDRSKYQFPTTRTAQTREPHQMQQQHTSTRVLYHLHRFRSEWLCSRSLDVRMLLRSHPQMFCTLLNAATRPKEEAKRLFWETICVTCVPVDVEEEEEREGWIPNKEFVKAGGIERFVRLADKTKSTIIQDEFNPEAADEMDALTYAFVAIAWTCQALEDAGRRMIAAGVLRYALSHVRGYDRRRNYRERDLRDSSFSLIRNLAWWPTLRSVLLKEDVIPALIPYLECLKASYSDINKLKIAFRSSSALVRLLDGEDATLASLLKNYPLIVTKQSYVLHRVLAVGIGEAVWNMLINPKLILKDLATIASIVSKTTDGTMKDSSATVIDLSAVGQELANSVPVVLKAVETRGHRNPELVRCAASFIASLTRVKECREALEKKGQDAIDMIKNVVRSALPTSSRKGVGYSENDVCMVKNLEILMRDCRIIATPLGQNAREAAIPLVGSLSPARRLRRVALSYDWRSLDAAKLVYQILTSEGLVVWMESCYSGWDLFGEMTLAIKNCSHFVAFVNTQYENSLVCRRRECGVVALENASPEIQCYFISTENGFVPRRGGFLESFIGRHVWHPGWSNTALNATLKNAILPEMKRALDASASAIGAKIDAEVAASFEEKEEAGGVDHENRSEDDDSMKALSKAMRNELVFVAQRKGVRQ